MDTAVCTSLMLFIRNYAKTPTKGIMCSPKWTFLEFRNTAIAGAGVGGFPSKFEHLVLV